MAYDIRLVKIVTGELVIGKYDAEAHALNDVVIMQTVPTQQGVKRTRRSAHGNNQSRTKREAQRLPYDRIVRLFPSKLHQTEVYYAYKISSRHPGGSPGCG